MEPERLPTPAEVEAALTTVYARPELTDRQLPFLLRWLRDTYAALKDALREVLAELLSLQGARPVLFWILTGWIALTLAAILVHLVVSAWYGLRGAERRPGDTIGPRPPTVRDVDWGALAREASAAGRFREAALALYHELLVFLRDRGMVRVRDSRTPREYLREVRRGDPPRAERFADFLRHFEPMAFGPTAPGAPAYVRLEEAAREVRDG